MFIIIIIIIIIIIYFNISDISNSKGIGFDQGY